MIKFRPTRTYLVNRMIGIKGIGIFSSSNNLSSQIYPTWHSPLIIISYTESESFDDPIFIVRFIWSNSLVIRSVVYRVKRVLSGSNMDNRTVLIIVSEESETLSTMPVKPLSGLWVSSLFRLHSSTSVVRCFSLRVTSFDSPGSFNSPRLRFESGSSQ